MRGWAFGLLHIPRSEFVGMRLGEFWEALAAYSEEKESERRHTGELVRGATVRLLNIQIDPKHQIADVTKFWPMPWDKTPEDGAVERLRAMSIDEKTENAKAFLDRVGWTPEDTNDSNG